MGRDRGNLDRRTDMIYGIGFGPICTSEVSTGDTLLNLLLHTISSGGRRLLSFVYMLSRPFGPAVLNVLQRAVFLLFYVIAPGGLFGASTNYVLSCDDCYMPLV